MIMISTPGNLDMMCLKISLKKVLIIQENRTILGCISDLLLESIRKSQVKRVGSALQNLKLTSRERRKSNLLIIQNRSHH